MKYCATTTCRNLIDPDARVYCSRCKPGQSAEQRLADIKDVRAQAAARRELQHVKARS